MALGGIPGVRSLRRQLVIIMCLAYILVSAMTLAMGYTTQRQNLQAQLRLRAQNDAKILAAGSLLPMNIDKSSSNVALRSLLASVSGAEGVSVATIRASTGCVLASTNRRLIGTGCGHSVRVLGKARVIQRANGSIEALAPIFLAAEGARLGVAMVTLSNTSIQKNLRSDLLLELSVRAVGLLGFFLLSLFIAQFITGPMRSLTAAALNLRRGRLNTRVPMRGQREIDTVAEAFNEMAEALEVRIKHLSFLASSGATLPGTLRSHHDVGPILQGFGAALDLEAAGLLGPEGPSVWWPEGALPDQEVAETVVEDGASLQMREGNGRSWLTVPVPGDSAFVAVRGGSQGFTDEERDVIVNFAYQLGIAADNARLVEEQHEALQVKDQFLSIVSHELRTPLTTMKGYAQLLERKLAGDEDSQRWASSIDAQIGRLSRLVDDLLDVTRFARGQFELRRREVALAPILEDTVSRFRIISPQHTVTLEDVDPALVGSWDRDRLEQVLNNLVGNAIKYSPEGGEVTVSARVEGDVVVVRVRDQGIGISHEDQERLFDRFYRASPERRGGATGLGLGLYVTRRVVEAHGGIVGVRSEPGSGSEFYFTLPMVPVQQEQGTPV